MATKLQAAASAGFKGVEVFYEDLEVHASQLPGGQTDSNIVAAATEFHRLCNEYSLTVICIQPFMHYEGLLSATERDQRWQKLQLWFQLVRILDTNTIQVPSNFLQEGISGDFATIVSDLQRLADAGAQQCPPVRFAYENICWGTYISTWKQMWHVVAAVDRDNFGMCLDTFHLCGREWADPAADSGTVGANADEMFEKSMQEMARTIDVRKVFYVQVADAEQAVPPMREEAGNKWWADEQPARMTWSRNMRVFGFEVTGYMPVNVALATILEPPPTGLGYKGWVSMEVFSWSLMEKDKSVPETHAERARRAWSEIQKRLTSDSRRLACAETTLENSLDPSINHLCTLPEHQNFSERTRTS